METSRDRYPYGRDYPISLGICPVCEEEVETECVHESDDEGVKRWGEVVFHAACVPTDLRPCGACGELEEPKRLDWMGNCANCKALPGNKNALG